jgi:hypothetical protein
MNTEDVIQSLLQWMLGMLAVGIIAIVAGYIDTARKLALLMQRVVDHIKNCELLHSKHDTELESIRQEIRGLKE